MLQMCARFDLPETKSRPSLERKLQDFLSAWAATQDSQLSMGSEALSGIYTILIPTLSSLSEIPLYGPAQVKEELPNGEEVCLSVEPCQKWGRDYDPMANVEDKRDQRSYQLTIQPRSSETTLGAILPAQICAELDENLIGKGERSPFQNINSPSDRPLRWYNLPCPHCNNGLRADLYGWRLTLKPSAGT